MYVEAMKEHLGSVKQEMTALGVDYRLIKQTKIQEKHSAYSSGTRDVQPQITSPFRGVYLTAANSSYLAIVKVDTAGYQDITANQRC